MYSTGVGFDWGGVLMGPLSEGCFVSVGAWDFVVSWYGQRGLPCMHMVVWAKGQLENKCEILISLVSIMNLPEGLGQIKEDP